NVMFFETGETHALHDHGHLPVDARLFKSQFASAGQHVLMKAFAAAHYRRQKRHLLSVKTLANAVKNLTATLHRQWLSTIDAVLYPSLRVEQPQIVINLGDRRNR